MAESSATKPEYETKVAKRFGFAQQLELPMPMPVVEEQEAANRGGLWLIVNSPCWGLLHHFSPLFPPLA
jgi:hypothetical protein